MRRTGRITALAAALTLTALAVSPAAAETATQPPQPASFSLAPLEVQPGGRVETQAIAFVCLGNDGPGPVTSPGFTAPIEWGSDTPGTAGAIYGAGAVIDTPGKYVASLECRNGQSRAEVEFTILQPTTTPPTTEPPAPPTTTPAPPPIKKPKGAPETGGGGTA
ncbi:hypothetical protein [Saccharothrix deserti]|uniref:hypothetical protein n=1 Tax=Saccharothrix deserti TaxID=2593674 RepID=UPI00131A71B8|nr:hypothetical protein [Saccharothrix deserti]